MIANQTFNYSRTVLAALLYVVGACALHAQPELFCNEKLWEESFDNCSAFVYLVEPDVLNDDDGDLSEYTVSHNGPQDQIFPVGVTILTWTVSGPTGTSQCDQEIEVLDVVVSTMVCQLPLILAYAEPGQCDAEVNVSASTIFNCNPPVVDGEGTQFFPVGDTDVQLTATDVSGVVTVCNVTVRVFPSLINPGNCGPQALGDAYDGLHLQTVGLESYLNKTGDNMGYGNYTDHPVEVEGDLSQVSLYLSAAHTYTPGMSYYYSVWADFNCDNDFEDANETWYQGYSFGDIDLNLDLPAGACADVRVRVRVTSFGFGLSTGVATSGEVEDYLLQVPQVTVQANDWDEQPQLTDGMHVFPNPARGEVTIQTVNGTAATTDLVVTDMLGRVFFQQRYDNGLPVEGLQLDITRFGAGTYFVTSYANGELLDAQRLVVLGN